MRWIGNTRTNIVTIIRKAISTEPYSCRPLQAKAYSGIRLCGFCLTFQEFGAYHPLGAEPPLKIIVQEGDPLPLLYTPLIKRYIFSSLLFRCKVCETDFPFSMLNISNHLIQNHKLTMTEYKRQYPAFSGTVTYINK